MTGNEDDDAVRDSSLRPPLSAEDEYRRESLDERLAEEEPDSVLRAQDPESPPMQAPESGETDLDVATSEPDDDEPIEQGQRPAEESAVHVVPEDRV